MSLLSWFRKDPAPCRHETTTAHGPWIMCQTCHLIMPQSEGYAPVTDAEAVKQVQPGSSPRGVPLVEPEVTNKNNTKNGEK